MNIIGGPIILAIFVFIIYFIAGRYPFLAGIIAIIPIKVISAIIGAEKCNIRDVFSGALIAQSILLVFMFLAYFFYFK